jgi:hypothetical protein
MRNCGELFLRIRIIHLLASNWRRNLFYTRSRILAEHRTYRQCFGRLTSNEFTKIMDISGGQVSMVL